MTPTKARIDSAMRRAKAHFGECIVTTTGEVDGAHIFPRSTYPYLAGCQYNIVPLTRHVHRAMDSTTRPVERIEWLRNHVNPEHRATLDQWLIELFKEMLRAQ